VCGSCGAELAEGAKFCPDCGTKVGALAPAAVQEAPAQAAGARIEEKIEKIEVPQANVLKATKHFEKGSSYFDADKYDKAIQEFSAAIELNPNYDDAYTQRGASFWLMDDNATALLDLNHAVGLNPESFMAYFWRASVHELDGAYEDALYDAKKAIGLDKKSVNAYNLMGNSYTGLGDYANAVASYSQAIVLDANSSSSYLGRGRAYYNKEEYDKAVNDLDRAVKLDPQNEGCFYWRGMAYFSKDDFNRALQDFDKAVKLNPNDPYNYNMRGNAYYNQGIMDKAAGDYQAALNLSPGDETFAQNLANAQNGTPDDDSDDADDDGSDDDDPAAYSKCRSCGQTFQIQLQNNMTYQCPGCGEDVAVAFIGPGDGCNEIIGFQHQATGKALLGLGKAFLQGLLSDEEEDNKTKQSLFGRLFTKTVNARDFAECPICEHEFLLCPECGCSVRWPLNMDDDAAVKCGNCNTHMKHP
jgi:tetratricopeptide (TPR) repeat protein